VILLLRQFDVVSVVLHLEQASNVNA